ncbi:endonuclease/exonuclease/phosphatase family protein [Marivirga sp.]|uniref:endonuclease/exonuclease/phosphatase family protein n=1 Tax=Marivirga sp. TaxID=2018662 RepID=UPI003DA79EE5
MYRIKIYHLVFACFFLWGCNDEPLEEVEDEIISTPSLKVSSFNIRFDNPSDGSNRWINRRGDVLNFLLIEELDIIGMQEVLYSQIKFLDENLSTYQRVGIGRDDGEQAGEYAPIYFDTNRFNLLDSGNFWLSETPEVPSIGWDAVLNRICTYVRLFDTESDQEIYFYNTHFDHVGGTARLRSASLIRDSIQTKIDQGVRVILTGDLNVVPGSTPYEVFNEFMTDSYESDLKLGPTGTYNGFNLDGSHNRRIDFIFTTGFKPMTYESVSTVVNNRFLSDHFPVISKIEYRPVNY